MNQYWLLFKRLRLLLAVLNFCACAVVNAQDYSRVAPQVTNGTILIDRDTDLEKLKNKLLYISRHIDNDTARTYALIFESVKESLSSTDVVVPKSNDFLSKVGEFIKNKGDDIKTKIEANSNYPDGLKIVAKRKIEKLASGIDKDKFLKKVSGMIELYTQFNRTNRDSREQLQSYVDFLLGLGNVFEIPEADRIKGTADIIFTMQNVLEYIQLDVEPANGGSLIIKRKFSEVIVTTVASLETKTVKKNEEVILWLLDNIKPILKTELIQRLGRESEAVHYFDVLYLKLYDAVDALKVTNKSESKLYEVISQFLERPLSDVISDYELLQKNQTINYNELKTPIAKQFFEAHEAIVRAQQGTSRLKENVKEFLKEYYLNLMIDLVGNALNDKLKNIKNPTSIAWLNNFNVSDSVSELSTTIAYRIVNQQKFVWEATVNIYYNTAKRNSDSDSSKNVNPVTRHVILGSSFKWAASDKVEFGASIGASSDFLGNLSNINATAPSMYAGLNIALKPSKKGVIFRPFAEYEIRRSLNAKSTRYWNFGLEFKFPEKFILSSVFISHRKDDASSNSGSSLGITFPIIK
ncbi:MAG: hypothetical protein JSU09_16400 [Bacteroidetes bacterium]|nr:hypothetical protein [Bacteroidota bacterium]